MSSGCPVGKYSSLTRCRQPPPPPPLPAPPQPLLCPAFQTSTSVSTETTRAPCSRLATTRKGASSASTPSAARSLTCASAISKSRPPLGRWDVGEGPGAGGSRCGVKKRTPVGDSGDSAHYPPYTHACGRVRTHIRTHTLMPELCEVSLELTRGEEELSNLLLPSMLSSGRTSELGFSGVLCTGLVRVQILVTWARPGLRSCLSDNSLVKQTPPVSPDRAVRSEGLERSLAGSQYPRRLGWLSSTF